MVCFVFAMCGFVCFLPLVFAVEWHYTAWHHEYMKSATESASLAVISTASKYLHNELARAIEALEQKKIQLRTFECYCVLLCTTLLRRRVTELSCQTCVVSLKSEL